MFIVFGHVPKIHSYEITTTQLDHVFLNSPSTPTSRHCSSTFHICTYTDSQLSSCNLRWAVSGPFTSNKTSITHFTHHNGRPLHPPPQLDQPHQLRLQQSRRLDRSDFVLHRRRSVDRGSVVSPTTAGAWCRAPRRCIRRWCCLSHVSAGVGR